MVDMTNVLVTYKQQKKLIQHFHFRIFITFNSENQATFWNSNKKFLNNINLDKV